MTTPATLLPLPRSFAERPGSLDLSQGAVIVAAPGLEAQAGLLLSWLSPPLHGRVRVYGSPSADGSAGPAVRVSADAPGAATVELSLNASFAGKEEYRLEVSAGRASVAASTTEGLVRGASTLLPLPRSFAERPGSLDLSQGAVIVAAPGLIAQADLLVSWLSSPLHGRVRVYGSPAADGSACAAGRLGAAGTDAATV